MEPSERRELVVQSPVRQQASAANAFLEKKTLRELDEQVQRLRDECAQKDERINELEDITANGKLQKHLQKTLEDNRDMRRQLDQLYAEKGRADGLASELEEQKEICDILKTEIAEYQKRGEEMIAQIKDDQANVEDELQRLERQIEERKESEEVAVQKSAELQRKVEQLEETNVHSEMVVARLKDGSRVAQLEITIESLTEQLDQKEQNRLELEAQLHTLSGERHQAIVQQENFEALVQQKLNEAISDVSNELRQSQERANAMEAEVEEEKQRFKQLEERVLKTDQHIIELMKQIQEYEEGYGIEEAMRDQRKLKAALVLRDEDVARTSARLCELEGRLQQLLDEHVVLKKLAGVPPDWGLQPQELKLSREIERERLEGLQRHYKDRVERLENERIELLDELRKKAVPTAEGGMTFFGLGSRKMAMVEAYAERLRDDDTTLPLGDASREQAEEVERLNQELVDQRMKYANVKIELDEMRQKLMAMSEKRHEHGVDRILESIDALGIQQRQQQQQQQQEADEIRREVVSPERLVANRQWNFVQDQVRSHSLPPPPASPLPRETPQQRALDDSSIAHGMTALRDLGEALGAVGSADTQARLLACIEELLGNEAALAAAASALQMHEAEAAKLSSNTALLFEAHRALKQSSAERQRELQNRVEHLEEENISLAAENKSISSYVQTLRERFDSGSTVDDVSDQYRRQFVVASAQLEVLARRNQAQLATLSLQEDKLLQTQQAHIEMQRVLRIRILNLEESLEECRGRTRVLEQDLTESVSVEQHERIVREQELTAMRLAASEVRAASFAQNLADIDKQQETEDEVPERQELEECEVAVLRRTLQEMVAGGGDLAHLQARLSVLEVREAGEEVRTRRQQQQLADERSRCTEIEAEVRELTARLEQAQADVFREREQRIGVEQRLADERRQRKLDARNADKRHGNAAGGQQAADSAWKRSAMAARQSLQTQRLLDEKSSEVDELRRALFALDERSEESARLGQVMRENLASKMQLNVARDRLAAAEREREDLEARLSRALLERRQADENAFVDRRSLRKRVQVLYKHVALLKEDARPGLSAEQARVVCDSNACVTNRLSACRRELIAEREKLAALHLQQEQAEVKRACDSESAAFSGVLPDMKAQVLDWSQRLRHLKLENLQLSHAVKSLRAKLGFADESVAEHEEDVRRLHRILAEKDAALEDAHVRLRDSVASSVPLQPSLPPPQPLSKVDVEVEETQKLRKELRALQAVLEAKEELIDELRRERDRERSRREELVAPDVLAEKERVLRTAEDTIASLQQLLLQKNGAIQRYASLLEQSLLKHRREKHCDRLELEQMHARLLDDNEKANANIREALKTCEKQSVHPDEIVAAERVRELLQQRDEKAATLVAELDASREREKKGAVRCREAEEREASLQQRVDELEGEIVPARKMSELVDGLRSDLGAKERKQRALEDAIVSLKEELVHSLKSASSGAAAVTPDDKQQKQQLATLRQSLTTLQNKLRKSDARCGNANVELKALKKQLAAEKDAAADNASLSSELERLKDANTALGQKLRAQSKTLTLLEKTVEQLRSELALKAAELHATSTSQDRIPSASVPVSRSNAAVQTMEAAAADDPEEKASQVLQASSGAFESWEQHKRQQRRIELLKSKLRQRGEALQQAGTREEALQAKLRVGEKDKGELLARIEQLQHARPQKLVADAEIDSVEELRRKLFEAEEESLHIRRQLEVELPQALQRLRQHEHAALKERERKGADASHSDRKIVADLAKLREENDSLEQRLLTASCDNLELRFDAEQACVSEKRLRKRLRDLGELLEARQRLERSPTAAAVQQEKTKKQDDDEERDDTKGAIESLSKLVETLRKENEVLKRNSHSNAKYMDAVRALRKAKSEWGDEVAQLNSAARSSAEQLAELKRVEAAAKLKLRQQRKEIARLKKEAASVSKTSANANEQITLLQQSVTALEQQVELLNKKLAQQTRALKAANDKRLELQRLLDEREDSKLVVAEEMVDAAVSAVGQQELASEELQVLQLAHDELLAENEALKNELSAFDASFFDEIEDLKFKYHEASQQLSAYQEQFGELG